MGITDLAEVSAAVTVTATATAPSPPQSPSHPNSSHSRQFYVAVDRIDFKMETLVDLLGVAGRRNGLPMVVCCSSRDELDAVCSSVSNLPYISFSSLYSDLAEAERTSVLDNFRQVTMKWNQNVNVQSGDENEVQKDEDKSHMIVVTDTCLPLLASGESPISARVLINYELPTKKETYVRRMATCLAADGIVINMVVGGEVVTLKSVEESSSLVIAEMPINTDDFFYNKDKIPVLFPAVEDFIYDSDNLTNAMKYLCSICRIDIQL